MSRDTTMRLLCNMATGKGLAIVFRPKTINLINNSNLNKFSCDIVQRCRTCHRSITTVVWSVGKWDSRKIEKCNVYFCLRKAQITSCFFRQFQFYSVFFYT